MALFNIWSFGSLPDRRIRFDVTAGNLPELKNGTPTWIEGVLRQIDVSGTPGHWEITAWRCNFYSDYPGSEAWEDRWPRGWTVTVEMDGEVPVIDPVMPRAPISFDEPDQTWDGLSDPSAHSRDALIVLLALHERQKAEQQISSWLSSLAGRESMTASQNDLASGGIEFRVHLRGVIFPERLAALDEFLTLAGKQGYLIDWQSYVSKRARS
jgi:hypothetical protein